MADYPSKQFFGTPQVIFDSTTDIAAGNFSGAMTEFTNNDAAVPNAEYALATIWAEDFAAAPAAGTVLELWGTLTNVVGTDDDTDAPSGTASNGARHFGNAVMAAVADPQRRSIVISLLGVDSGVVFYLKNATAQNMTGLKVTITPFAIGITV